MSPIVTSRNGNQTDVDASPTANRGILGGMAPASEFRIGQSNKEAGELSLADLLGSMRCRLGLQRRCAAFTVRKRRVLGAQSDKWKVCVSTAAIRPGILPRLRGDAERRKNRGHRIQGRGVSDERRFKREKPHR